jgi:hypothetical protein
MHYQCVNTIPLKFCCLQDVNVTITLNPRDSFLYSERHPTMSLNWYQVSAGFRTNPPPHHRYRISLSSKTTVVLIIEIPSCSFPRSQSLPFLLLTSSIICGFHTFAPLFDAATPKPQLQKLIAGGFHTCAIRRYFEDSDDEMSTNRLANGGFDHLNPTDAPGM